MAGSFSCADTSYRDGSAAGSGGALTNCAVVTDAACGAASARLSIGAGRTSSVAKYTVRSQSHGEFTTVRAGPITSREEAVQLCAKLRSAKQACVVVKA
ncbi:MAG: SPOR domain-containing protein [Sphingomonadaceae bacterium]|nr:SPOR domain-containing protein [Sphingomonadaceae bacterium]NBU78880.1 SPOR domain-containing protein [Sphingomonadaceae bacterium]NCA01301.1 SPOR domain-containing protein [Sphingomonadaceae bacterium]